MRTIPLTKGQVAIVDDEDVPLLSGRTWCAMKTKNAYYAVGSNHGKHVLMHRLLMNAQAGQDVDHKNGDGLDNRRENLRLATRAQNAANQRIRVGCTSSYRGVYFHTKRGSWMARIKVMYVHRYLGDFADEIAAAHAYDSAARQYFGEFARLNFPDSVPTEAPHA